MDYQLKPFAKGYQLGKDILSECFVLANCDKTYISESNIIFITSTINPSCQLEES